MDLSGQRFVLAEEEKAAREQLERSLIGREKPIFVDVKDYMFDLLGQEVLGRGSLMLTTAAQLHLFDPERFTMVPIRGSLWQEWIYLGRLAGQNLSAAGQALHRYLQTQWSGDDN